MNERDLETRLRDAYRVEAGRTDPGALTERVHSIPATVEPERRRWWHRFRSGATRHAGLGGAQVRGANSMMTITGVAAVVAAMALGTTFLATQTEDVPDAAGPPAAASGDTWITVTGTQTTAGAGDQGLYGKRIDVSDPRLEGDVTITFERDGRYGSSSGSNSTLWSTVTITNDEGSWEGLSIGFTNQTGGHHHTGWFEGTGAYDGLVYIEWLTEPEVNSAGSRLDVVGLLYEGELPPMVLPADAIE